MRIAVRVNGERHDAEIWEGDSLLFALRVLTRRALERCLAA